VIGGHGVTDQLIQLGVVVLGGALLVLALVRLLRMDRALERLLLGQSQTPEQARQAVQVLHRVASISPHAEAVRRARGLHGLAAGMFRMARREAARGREADCLRAVLSAGLERMTAARRRRLDRLRRWVGAASIGGLMMTATSMALLAAGLSDGRALTGEYALLSVSLALVGIGAQLGSQAAGLKMMRRWRAERAAALAVIEAVVESVSGRVRHGGVEVREGVTRGASDRTPASRAA
jgi:hypothetical protein